MTPDSPSPSPSSSTPDWDPTVERRRVRAEVKANLFGTPPDRPRIGRFEVQDRIGAGGMGIVYRAWDAQLGRTVAIKLLRAPEARTSASGRERLAHEAKALARLAHPNVVSIYDVGLHDGQVFIAMEYVEGETLAAWLEQGRELVDVLAVFIQAGRGLSAAHAQGLVHRDFKPDNVLVGRDGRPRVLDFGLARRSDADNALVGPLELPGDASETSTTMTEHGVVLGTPAYMAPEQHLGEPVDARADQFAFCVALYDALYGRRPFVGGDLRTLSLAVVRGRLPDAAQGSVPTWVHEVLARGLSVSPADRFDDMDALLGALARGLRQQHDVRLDSEEVRKVFDRAAQLELAADSRGLSPTEVARAAGEAGLRPELARRAIGELTAKDEAMVTAEYPEEHHLGLRTAVVVRRVLPVPLANAPIDALVREIERVLGVQGTMEHIGTSIVWTGPDTEAHIDPVGDRTAVQLVWRCEKAARRAVRIFTPLGLPLGLILVAMVGAAFNVDDPVVGPMILSGVFGGLFSGYRFARRTHNRRAEQMQKRLAYLAERLDALASGGQSRRALPER